MELKSCMWSVRWKRKPDADMLPADIFVHTGLQIGIWGSLTEECDFIEGNV
ncbi:hypothetical protein QQ045_018867 [Rhodiola kirilowii]